MKNTIFSLSFLFVTSSFLGISSAKTVGSSSLMTGNGPKVDGIYDIVHCRNMSFFAKKDIAAELGIG